MESLAKSKENIPQLVHLDPRTKMFLALATNITVLSIPDERVTLTGFIVSIILLTLIKAGKTIAILTIIGAVCVFLRYVLPDMISGLLTVSLAIAAFLLIKFVIVFAVGLYVIRSTRPTEFIVAARHMHTPQTITIPLTVMFRFFPTILQELRAILDAMKLRGIPFNAWYIALHPLKTTEHLIVPLLGTIVRSGEELTASALTRGLGSPGPVTTVHKIGFGWGDLLGLILASALFGVAMLTRFT